MRNDNYPERVSDPEAEGLPATADDDSTAYDDVETGRWADGPDPAALPAEHPVAVDKFGTTAEEQRVGESLDYRLAQEQPDIQPEDPLDAPGSLDADVYGESPTSDPNSKVSLYDFGQLDGTTPAPVGRLVEPDEGYGYDAEPDSVAYDAGAAGGGPTAEEAAVHETEAPGYR